MNTDDMDIKFISDFVVPASEDYSKDRHFYLYEGNVDNEYFEVYEGDGAEVFTLSELSKRSDLIATAKYTFDHIIEANRIDKII